MWLDVNGKRMQTGNTHHGVQRGEDHLAREPVHDALPGDIIATGTPPGVGLGMKPTGVPQARDVMTLGIQGLGEQRQRWSLLGLRKV